MGLKLTDVVQDLNATSLPNSRASASNGGRAASAGKCSDVPQAYMDLVGELVANLQFGLGPDSLLHCNILNRAGFCQRV